jgi:hypothetical protein
MPATSASGGSTQRMRTGTAVAVLALLGVILLAFGFTLLRSR